MSYHAKKVIMRNRQARRASLLGFGDAITDPSQVDPSLGPAPQDPDSTVVGTVQADRKSCDALPADSPWRQPGQVCGPVKNWLTDLVDNIKNTFGQPMAPAPSSSSDAAASASSAADGVDTSKLLLLAGLGGAAYWYFTKKKKRG